MLSNIDREMISEHVDMKKKRCTRKPKKLRRNAVLYARGLGATNDEIAEILVDLGLDADLVEIEQILNDEQIIN
jgi:hypothetical protein